MDHEPGFDGTGELFAELDKLGEVEVNKRLETEAFPPAQVPFVREWLLRKIEERARRASDRG